MRRSRVFLPWSVWSSPSARAAARTKTGDGDDGFSIIEVTIAIAIFAIVATFTAQLLAGGMRGVLSGKRREAASHEANRLLEVARSLSYNAVGLDSADTTLGSDSAIQTQSGVKKYLVGSAWEPVVYSTASSNPFNPHSSSVTRGSTSLTRYVYVTGVDSDNDGAVDLKRMSVRVTWVNSGSAGPRNEVRAQTLISPNGVVSVDSTSGGAGGGSGGLTPLKTDTFASGGTVSVKSAVGAAAGLIPAVLPSIPVTMDLASTKGSSYYRSVISNNCTATSTKLSGAGTTIYGGHSVTVTADDDAQTPTSSTPAPVSWSGSPPDSVNGVDDISTALLETTLASPVSCQATSVDNDGVTPSDDQLPYEAGSASALGTVNLVRDLTGLNLGLGTNLLTAVDVQALPMSQSIDDQIVNNNRETVASASGSLGLVNVMKLPGIFNDGLVRIDSLTYGATVRGTDGTPSAAPSVTAPTISFRVYDIANQIPNSVCSSRTGGYCVVTATPGANGFPGLSIDFSHNITANLGLTNLIYEIHVDVLPPSKDGVNGATGPNGEKRWSAEYTPITVSAELKMDLSVPLVGHVVLVDASADLNLGSVKAGACAGVTC